MEIIVPEIAKNPVPNSAFRSLPQLQIHNQRRRELSDMSKEGLVGGAEVAQHMLCWQNLLTAQSLELADLINSLDEEAAAEIRKVVLICAPHTHTHTHTHIHIHTYLL